MLKHPVTHSAVFTNLNVTDMRKPAVLVFSSLPKISTSKITLNIDREHKCS